MAERISDVLNPYWASAPFFFLVAADSSTNIAKGFLYWLICALFFSVLPMWDINRRIRRGLVADMHISRREDRIRPFLFALGCAVCGLAAIYIANAPAPIKAVSWMVVLTGAVITALTAVWKVSLHAAGVSAISIALIALYGLLALPILLLIPLVFWARLTLKKHSPAQLVAGSLIAAGIAAAVFWHFGFWS